MRSRRFPFRLTVLALLVCTLAVTPLAYLFIRAAGADAGLWGRLWQGQIPLLLANTLKLFGATVLWSVALGTAAAWLIERTDLPGRRFWRVALMLPLAVPAYVAAICYVLLLRRGGLLEAAAMRFAGFERGELALPSVYGLAGATWVMGLCVFPYVYLTVAAALRSIDRTLEEVARTTQRGGWATFRSVTLPLIWPAIAAGGFLVGLYVVSDFGTVAMLRYRTFTTAIYNQFSGQTNRAGAAVLSFVLVGLTLPLLAGEAWFNRRDRRYTRDRSWQPRRMVPLGRWRWLALAFVGLLGFFSLGLPLLVLGGLTLQGLLAPTEVDRIWGVGGAGVWRYGLNSVLVAAGAATLATLLAFAPTYLAARHPRRFAWVLLSLSKTAYVLPGLIVGLAFVMLFNRSLPIIYGTVAALVLGFTFRLLPQSVVTSEAALKRVPASLEQAARSMGYRAPATFGRVTIPLAAPGLAASWTLVFVSAMKELPTAILLRPPGFDTLPVRIWAAASESVHTQAAPPALLLVGLTMAVLALLYGRRQRGLERAIQDQGAP